MLHNPFKIVEMFEEEIAFYTNAKFAIATDSCTNAIFLCCKFLKIKDVTIPARTYLSVAQSILQAGGTITFEDLEWKGIYQIKPYLLYDAAKRLTSGMYIENSLMCLSFHIKKHIKIGKGGMILTDDKTANDWFKKARYEGRSNISYHDDDITISGHNFYMTPEQAARGLTLMQHHPLHAEDLIEMPPYRDLREFSLFNKPS